MPSPLEIKLSEYLYDAFRVEFDARIRRTDEGVSIAARPSSPARDRMWMECSFHNTIRLGIRAIPEAASAPFFETMAGADLKHRMRCSEDILKLLDDVHDLRFMVGKVDLCETPITDWPNPWPSLLFDAVVWPVPTLDGFDALVEYSFDWLHKAFIPFFDLLDIEFEVLGYTEGERQRSLVNKYERDERNRKLCIEARGCRCAICGFDFEESYGELGKGFIHVHHIVPVSKIGPNYIIDPVKDLIPVCPNCHAMLHRVDPPMDPNMLSKILGSNRRNK